MYLLQYYTTCGIIILIKDNGGRNMWWISILMDIFLAIISVIICVVYYKKSADYFFIETMRTHSILYGNSLNHRNNYSNIYANIILKCVVALICIIVIHFFDSLWIGHIYLLYLFFSYFVFNNRRKEYNSLTPDEKKLIKPAYCITILIPIMHTLFYISLALAYLWNT